MAEGACIQTAQLPGEKSVLMLKNQAKYESSIVSYPKSMPIALKRAKGAIVEDVDGNLLIDFFGFAGVLNVGHCNPYVSKYVEEQGNELIHALDFPTENKQELIAKIMDRLPPKMRDQYKIAFCAPTGSDAVEAAIKLAKHYTGRRGIIAFQGSYHGMTSGALSLSSDVRLRNRIAPMLSDIHFLPYSYCYRCPFDLNRHSCELECAKNLESVLENPHSGILKPAALILEPIQGEGGTVIPREGYLEKIIEIANKHQVLTIFDEIQCGFFRTGKLYEFLNTDAVPDIITMSKGLGGIGYPISAILYKKEIESWGPGTHIGTFRGNQVSIAAGRGALDFIEAYELEKHVPVIGNYLKSRLIEMKQRFPFIGEVRGKGLFIAIEYVKDPVSKTPDPEIIKAIRQICFNHGLLFEVGGHFDNVIRFIPPLIVTKVIVDDALRVFEMAHEEVMKRVTIPERTQEVVHS